MNMQWNRIKWLSRASSFSVWAFVLISAYILLSIGSNVGLPDIVSVGAFYIFWVLLPGYLLARCLGFRHIVAGLLALGLGVFINAAIFCLGIVLNLGWLYSVFYPCLVAVWGIAWAYRMIRTNQGWNERGALDVPGLVVCIVGIILLGWYRARFMDAGNMLPFNVMESARAWPDLLWAMGNAASLKVSVFPSDFHIAGEALRYHYLYHQMLAACSNVFGSELFVLVTRSFPIVISMHLVMSSYALGRLLTKRWQGGFWAVALCWFAVCIGYKSSYIIGAYTTVNLFTSPTIAFAIAILMGLFAQIPEWQSHKIRVGNYIALFLLLVVLMGAKVSVGAVAIAGVVGWCGIQFVVGRHARFVYLALVAGLAFNLAYFFFYWGASGVMGGEGISFAFPNQLLFYFTRSAHVPLIHQFIGFVSAHISRELSILLAVGIGILFHHLVCIIPIAIATYKERKNVVQVIQSPVFLICLCAMAGIIVGLTLDIEINFYHFYHPGVVCLSLVAAVIIGRSDRFQFKSWLGIAMVILVVLSAIPLIGDSDIPYYNGDMDDGVPMYDPKDLDVNLLHAFRFVRDNSDLDTVLLTGNPRLVKAHSGGAYNFYASAFAERQLYLEGWMCSNFRCPPGQESIFIRERLEKMRMFYGAVSPVVAEGALSQMGVTWMMWDTRVHGAVPEWMDTLMTPEFTSGTVRVYSVPDGQKTIQ